MKSHVEEIIMSQKEEEDAPNEVKDIRLQSVSPPLQTSIYSDDEVPQLYNHQAVVPVSIFPCWFIKSKSPNKYVS